MDDYNINYTRLGENIAMGYECGGSSASSPSSDSLNEESSESFELQSDF